ncbi:MAG: prevent-host-death protein [Oribacterium sp.]|nr:prevent-host-death protein [Oribacterium sp.]
MPTIAPVSELRNYGQILEKVKPNSPVYLTKNGHGQFSVHSIEDDEEFEKAKAIVKLMAEINKGILSGEENGWLSDEDLDRHFREKRMQKEKMLMEQKTEG